MLHYFTVAASELTYTVDTTVDNAALTARTAVANVCSLHGAIAVSNTTVTANTIEFAIPGWAASA
jgi:hypothetical protein